MSARTEASGDDATPAARGTTVLDLQDVRKSFGRSQILTGVDLTVFKGDRHAIIGPNGAGKSTLFDVISARCAPTSGGIQLKGEDIARLSARQVRRRGLSRSFQINNLFPALTVFDNLRCAVLWPLGYGYSFWHKLAGLRDVDERASAVLEQIGLSRKRDVLASVLTYAEQRALEIGITIAGGADVVLLDEPTSGMSRSESDEAVALIRKVSQGKTLLLVEHDMNVVFGLADRISVLVYGRILATGTPAEIRANAAVQEAYLGA
ncbi:MAG TPA: ABC transporter ATP-binding protein [Myxococcales bacterium]|jgi:branched-chain amino acid transport system ATP-binding protein